MMKKRHNVMKNQQGIAWVFVVLPILILALCILILIPVYQEYRDQAKEIGCVSALKTANDQLAIAYLSNGDMTRKEAKEVVTKAMDGWDDICVANGTMYLVERKSREMPYEVVCGLHDKDTKERTRLNASYVLKQVKKQLRSAQIQGQTHPEQMTVEFNGKKYEARLTKEEKEFKSGTTKKKEKGITIYYSVAGYGDFSANSNAKDGEIAYFSFTDENQNAIWRSKNGWLGSSYR